MTNWERQQKYRTSVFFWFMRDRRLKKKPCHLGGTSQWHTQVQTKSDCLWFHLSAHSCLPQDSSWAFFSCSKLSFVQHTGYLPGLSSIHIYKKAGAIICFHFSETFLTSVAFLGVVKGRLGHYGHAKGHQSLVKRLLGAHITPQTASSLLAADACLITDYCLMKVLTHM